MALAVHGHGALLHGLEQRCLGLGGGAIDFVGEHEIGENRSRAECKLLRAAARQHGDSGDIGRHQIGRELNADEAHTHSEPERADQQGLRSARHAFEQDVAAREQADEDLAEGLVLSEHDAAQGV